ncbi:MAG: hypothetical protein EZS28_045064 [Streblomastix strix]|uniref:Protein kinase domain-containing protein n=1 Tax=Streblomastix strix TaxID=222440 RepID=A0A5J4TN40_9EUKA|nr:MAG: hypothetical protein EZS28_045064 [Streblomastix strix]
MEDSKLLESEGFQVLKTLGSGAQGNVFLVHQQQLGFLAAKVMKNDFFDTTEWDIAGILSKDPPQTCPFIIRNIAAKQFDKSTIILMDYANMEV